MSFCVRIMLFLTFECVISFVYDDILKQLKYKLGQNVSQNLRHT